MTTPTPPTTRPHLEVNRAARFQRERGVGGGGEAALDMGGQHDRLSARGEAVRHGPSRAGVPMVRPHFRMSRAMADAINSAAAGAGLTAPAWLRAVVADRLEIGDATDRQPVRRYGSGSPDAQALTALRLQLHMLGGLLVQTAKASRKEGDAVLHDDAEQTLADVRAAIQTVAAWQESKP